MRKKIIFGNWKMNGTNASLERFLETVNANLKGNDVVAGLAVPFTLLATGEKHAGKVKIAAQNVHFAANGAYTGEVSIEMLQELGVKYVVLGHSERREMFNETNESVNQKVKALLAHDMTPIICCGETLATKEAGQTISFVNDQIALAYKGLTADQALKTIIAYEPIWAIGTGKTATAQDAEEVCRAIRQQLAKLYNETTANGISILYGGSVKPDNIKELMNEADIDGALVGGASLKADDYLALVDYK
ncbi:triosephosphate isomerase [Entomoplasma freundtii]|uniref:Triosephosphate isomerase n=1 Tax=Entomoplasma freundtii TaxID=74700 RepID=A0A2K8NSP7_9MOLU|nr:triose-phosphate isomerase [Entomoplasma freundtii]ATZ16188.1 triosephosphate isomerase [Entomoplasma freundtii]TDY56911.1 triosephosphate isomerase [Entomoplasma freundtii]